MLLFIVKDSKIFFFLMKLFYLCYNNNEYGKFYKCAINYMNSDTCYICNEGYHLENKDKKCSKIEGYDI